MWLTPTKQQRDDALQSFRALSKSNPSNALTLAALGRMTTADGDGYWNLEDMSPDLRNDLKTLHKECEGHGSNLCREITDFWETTHGKGYDDLHHALVGIQSAAIEQEQKFRHARAEYAETKAMDADVLCMTVDGYNQAMASSNETLVRLAARTVAVVDETHQMVFIQGAAIASHVPHMLMIHDRAQAIEKHKYRSQHDKDQESASRAHSYPWSKCVLGPCKEHPWQNEAMPSCHANHFTLPETFRVGPRITAMMRKCIDAYKNFQCPQERDSFATTKAPDTDLRLAIYAGKSGSIVVWQFCVE